MCSVVHFTQNSCVALDYSFEHNKNSNPTIEIPNGAGSRYRCIAEIQSAIVETFRPWFDKPTAIVYADPATNNNIGDLLQWGGSIKLFRRVDLFTHTKSSIKILKVVCTFI